MKGIVKICTILLPALLFGGTSMAQGVGINTGGNNPSASAILDVSSLNQGMLTPRMTQAERDAIAGPATGLLIYQTDNRPGFRFYDGTEWVFMRGMTSVSGRINVDVDNSCGVTNEYPPGYGAFSATFDCDDGTGSVSWPAGIFQNNPIVNLSSSVISVPPPAPDIYCVPVYFAPCTTSFNADQITGVRVYESTTGNGGPYNEIMEHLSDCEGENNGNYSEVPVAVATCTMSGNNAPGCNDHWYQIEIRSSVEWNDPVQAFIDWNADGDFFDAEEHIPPNNPAFGNSQGNWVLSDNFEVPASALQGNVVMRCRSYWAASAGDPNDPCVGGTWGETQDYTITIDCADTGPAPEIPSICAVLNVTTTSFDFKCTLLSGFPAEPPMINYDLVPVE